MEISVLTGPIGGIDAVCAGAGIVDSAREFERPVGRGDEPPEKPPNLDAMDVNFTGMQHRRMAGRSLILKLISHT